MNSPADSVTTAPFRRSSMRRSMLVILPVLALGGLSTFAGPDPATGDFVEAISGFAAGPVDTLTAVLTWNAARGGNYYNGYFGPVTSYELRYSTAPVVDTSTSFDGMT